MRAIKGGGKGSPGQGYQSQGKDIRAREDKEEGNQEARDAFIVARKAT